MGYIADLTVMLDDIFRTAPGNVTANDVQSAVDRHINSGRKDRIHRDIHSFVAETFAIRFTVPQRDLVLEKIIDLIRQYCVPAFYMGTDNNGRVSALADGDHVSSLMESVFSLTDVNCPCVSWWSCCFNHRCISCACSPSQCIARSIWDLTAAPKYFSMGSQPTMLYVKF